jgi:hypothetical protein
MGGNLIIIYINNLFDRVSGCRVEHSQQESHSRPELFWFVCFHFLFNEICILGARSLNQSQENSDFSSFSDVPRFVRSMYT